MSDLRTIYTVKGKNFPNVWEFHYDLNGNLKEFKLLDGELSDKQKNWLFFPTRFPYTENMINSWKTIKNIEVIIGKPEVTFDAFWNAYKKKVGKLEAERAWKKLTIGNKLKAIQKIGAYDKFLRRKHISKADPSTYLNKRRFDDEFESIH